MSEGKRSQRVANLLKAYEADRYLSPRGAFDYMLEDGIFPLPDCEVVSHLSIVDAPYCKLAQRKQKNIVQAAGQYKIWDEMMKEKK